MREFWSERAVLAGIGVVLLLMVVAGGTPRSLAMATPMLLIGGLVLGVMTRKQPVGGWLFVYYWGMAVTTVLTMPSYPWVLWNGIPAMSGGGEAAIAWVLLLAQFCASAALVWSSVRLLFRRTHASLSWVRRALWVMLGLLALALAFEFWMLQGSEDRTGPIGALRPILVTLVWLLYFERSERVKKFVRHQTTPSGELCVGNA